MSIEKILIYRLSSLGDTVVTLPIFHAIKYNYPNSHRTILTNKAERKETFTMSLLRGTELIDDAIGYSRGINWKELLKVRKKIVKYNPDILFYIFARPLPYTRLIRDQLFFYSCKITNIIGMPYNLKLRSFFYKDQYKKYEHVSEYLSRCISKVVKVELDNPAYWSIHLKKNEHRKMEQKLKKINNIRKIIVIAPGTKIPIKDWGIENWKKLMSYLSTKYKNFGAVFIGVESERKRCSILQKYWIGPSLNLAGRIGVRECASLIQKVDLFLGHDSGPMHLASIVQTPIVAIFSSRAKKGVWFPYPNRVDHEIVYHKFSCSNCNLIKDEDCQHNKRCINSITPEEVVQAVAKQIKKYC